MPARMSGDDHAVFDDHVGHSNSALKQLGCASPGWSGRPGDSERCRGRVFRPAGVGRCIGGPVELAIDEVACHPICSASWSFTDTTTFQSQRSARRRIHRAANGIALPWPRLMSPVQAQKRPARPGYRRPRARDGKSLGYSDCPGMIPAACPFPEIRVAAE